MFRVDSLFGHSNDGGVEFTLVGGSVPNVSASSSPLKYCAYVYNIVQAQISLLLRAMLYPQPGYITFSQNHYAHAVI